MDATVHAVRNSLAAILLGVDLLGRRGDAEGAGPVLEHIDSAAKRLTAQVEELADLSRLAAGRPISVARKRFAPHLAVAAAIADALPQAMLPTVEHDRLGQGECHGDAARIAQFVRLALHHLGTAARANSSFIVVSEVAGERFRIAVHASTGEPSSPSSCPVPEIASACREALMRAIARVHGGDVRFMHSADGAEISIEGTFTSSPGRCPADCACWLPEDRGG